ncbi:hypothetical protein WJ542_03570 [Paraburkholderia sp. B3]|uniref:hypothetical protein n=1 Tax=Paraburkholderia sp. B3 TaxID=3134791 RepID=UPI003981AF36
MFCLLREITQVSYVFNFHLEHAFFNLEERDETSRTTRVRLQQRRIAADGERHAPVGKLAGLAALAAGIASNPKRSIRLPTLSGKAHYIQVN